MDEILIEVLKEFKETSEYPFIYRKMVAGQLIPEGDGKEAFAKVIEQLLDDACEIASYKYCLNAHKGEILDDVTIEAIKNEAYNLAELLSGEVMKEYLKGDIDCN